MLDLAGIAISDAELSLKNSAYKQRGALLITHWGFSGPAALKLSAWAARDLHACQYQTELFINWVPQFPKGKIEEILADMKRQKPLKTLDQENPFQLPLNLWKRLIFLNKIPINSPIGHLADKQLKQLATQLTHSSFTVDGKTTYKQEFVTSGGIHLKEIDFKTLESRLIENLFFAGEILNIDGITGGFNFQNAWTSAYLAASCIAKKCKQ